MYVGYVGLWIEAPRDTRLVCDNGDWDAGTIEAGYCLGCAQLELDALNVTNVVVVLNDGPVAVEQDTWPHVRAHATMQQRTSRMMRGQLVICRHTLHDRSLRRSRRYCIRMGMD